MNRTAQVSLLFSSIAGAFLVGTLYNHPAAAGKGSTVGRRILHYVDPMHPAYKSDKPGTAPDCGMQLEPVYADGGMSTAPQGVVKIDDRKLQLSGVRTSSVEKTSGEFALRLFGRVAPDESRVYRINAGVEGYIQDVSDVTTGSQVKKDQLLATFSAPNASMPIQTFLLNLGAEDRYTQSEKAGSVEGQGMVTVNANILLKRQQLANMGISLPQIEEIKRTRLFPEKLHILAPADGLVLSRSVSPGLKFDRGAEWYRIADLSKVWVLADVFEKDAKYIRPGQTARVTLAGGGAAMSAKVSDILPQFDSGSRTFKVRLEMGNPGNALRPDMFVDVQLAIALPESLSVPTEAVLDSGLKKTVFVDRGQGYFEPRQVETGWRFDDRVQIVRGLDAGERIVTSATFLLDSETRMQQRVADAKPEMSGIAQDKDPVCGMGLKPAATQYKGEYGGERFYFCSEHCQHKFEKDPGAYLHKSAAGSGQLSPRGKS